MPPVAEEADIRPYDPKAREESKWHEGGTEDRYGKYPFAPYP